jgi:hypothetical protein
MRKATLLLPLLAACGGAAGPDRLEACAAYCASFVGCLDQGHRPDFPKEPLFCAGEVRSGACLTHCDAATRELEPEVDGLAACLACSASSDQEPICAPAVAGIAPAACSAACAGAGVGGLSRFQDRFESPMVADIEGSCQWKQTHSWPATDPEVRHEIGQLSLGDWACDPCTATGYLAQSPRFDLPVGRYEAGIRRLHLSGVPERTVGLLELAAGDSIVGPADRAVGPADLEIRSTSAYASQLVVTFEILAYQRDLELRFAYLADNGASGVVLGELFVRRVGDL